RGRCGGNREARRKPPVMFKEILFSKPPQYILTPASQAEKTSGPRVTAFTRLNERRNAFTVLALMRYVCPRANDCDRLSWPVTVVAKRLPGSSSAGIAMLYFVRMYRPNKNCFAFS